MTESAYAVQGMDCQHCIDAVTEWFSGIDSVRSVAVDLEAGRVVVDSEPPLTLEAAKLAVEEAGFEFKGVIPYGQ